MSDTGTESMLLAQALLEAIRSALKNGVRHYDSAGNLLTSPEAILEALAEEGWVSMNAPMT